MVERMETPRLKDIDEMATILRVPKSWLYGQTRRRGPGAIPVLRVGKHLRFDFDAVIAWLEERAAARES